MALEVSRQAFYDILTARIIRGNMSGFQWKCRKYIMRMNVTVLWQGNVCIFKAEKRREINISIPSSVRKVMEQIGLIHKPRRKPNGRPNEVR